VLICSGFIILLITRERMFLIGLRQAYFTTKTNAARLSSRVVLFLSVPDDAFKEQNLVRFFGAGAQRSWPVHELKELEKLVDNRDNHASQLEGSEMQFIRTICEKQNKKAQGSHGSNGQTPIDGERVKWYDEDARPRHRLWPYFWRKADSIDSARNDLSKVVNQIQDARESQSGNSSERRSGAIFIEYKDQATAHQAYQQFLHPAPLSLQPRYVGVQPKEVLWHNLTVESSLRITYSYLAFALILATIIFWAIPIGLVATLSNLQYLADNVSWLSWINNLSPSVLNLLTGLLPPLLVSTLVSYVPYIFRCKFSSPYINEANVTKTSSSNPVSRPCQRSKRRYRSGTSPFKSFKYSLSPLFHREPSRSRQRYSTNRALHQHFWHKICQRRQISTSHTSYFRVRPMQPNTFSTIPTWVCMCSMTSSLIARQGRSTIV